MTLNVGGIGLAAQRRSVKGRRINVPGLCNHMVLSASLSFCYCFTIFEKYKNPFHSQGIKNSMWTDLNSQALVFQLPMGDTVSSVVMHLACPGHKLVPAASLLASSYPGTCLAIFFFFF